MIAAIAPRVEGTGRREIDATGLVVAPGFIDLHAHARRGIFDDPSGVEYVIINGEIANELFCLENKGHVIPTEVSVANGVEGSPKVRTT